MGIIGAVLTIAKAGWFYRDGRKNGYSSKKAVLYSGAYATGKWTPPANSGYKKGAGSIILIEDPLEYIINHSHL